MKKANKQRSALALKAGTYSIVITVLVLAILIVANLFVSSLPATMTKLDMSASQLYSITSNTKAVVNNLQQDVTIYWVVQYGEEDNILANMLEKYDGLSSKIHVVKKNPDIYPTFAAQYTELDVPNNSLIVESSDRYRFIGYDELYESNVDYDSYIISAANFDGERAITSAIDYVVTEDLPIFCILEGHGELALPDCFSDALVKGNYLRTPTSLIRGDTALQTADAVVIYAPQTDISKSERDMLAEYLEKGGKLFVAAGPVEGVELTQLNSLLTDYGVTFADGFVMEGGQDNYAMEFPYVLMPNMYSSDITDSLIEENYHPVLPLAQGMTVTDTDRVTTLLTTTSLSYSKAAGFGFETYEKEEGDIAGPFAVAVQVQTEGNGQIVWISASDFLNDANNEYSSGANVDLAMNSLSAMIGDHNAISIRSKSLQYSYLTISTSTATLLKTLMIGVFPLAYLAIGGYVILTKRSKQNEKK